MARARVDRFCAYVSENLASEFRPRNGWGRSLFQRKAFHFESGTDPATRGDCGSPAGR